MRIFVTGVSGFIGQHVVRYLVQSGRVKEIVSLDQAEFPYETVNGVPIKHVVGDVRDAELCKELSAGVDSIIHLAAVASVPASIDDPVKTHEVNAGGTLNLLEAARTMNAPHLVVASSSAVYGEQPEKKKSEVTPTQFLSPYAATKGATESYALAYQAVYGVKVTALRFFNVFGPGQKADHPYAAVIPRFLEAILSELPLTVFGDGKQSRDFIPVETVAELVSKVSLRQLSCETPVNVASGNSISITKLIDELSKIHLGNFDVNYEDERPGDIRHSGAHVDRLHNLVPDLSYTDTFEALRTTYNWYRESLRRR